MTVLELRLLLQNLPDSARVVYENGSGYANEIDAIAIDRYPYKWSDRKEAFIKRSTEVAIVQVSDCCVVAQYPSF